MAGDIDWSPFLLARKMRNIAFLRFLLSGGLNTAATFILYWILLSIVRYQFAYAISFTAGIVLSYTLNTRFVFRATHSWSKFALFPVVCIVVYAVGALVLALAVDRFAVDRRLAPLISVCVTLPLSFLLNRWILAEKK